MKFKRLLIFIATFFCWLSIFILNAKLGLSRGIKSHSWLEIYDDLPFLIVLSFFVAIIFCVRIDFFSNKDDDKNNKTSLKRP